MRPAFLHTCGHGREGGGGGGKTPRDALLRSGAGHRKCQKQNHMIAAMAWEIHPGRRIRQPRSLGGCSCGRRILPCRRPQPGLRAVSFCCLPSCTPSLHPLHHQHCCQALLQCIKGSGHIARSVQIRHWLASPGQLQELL